MHTRLLGRVAIVTGGSGYIGKSIVEELVKEGCNVIFTYLKNKASADLFLLKMKKYKREVLAIKCDTRKIEDVKNVIDRTMTKFKKIDILVNNAGIGFVKPFEETTEDVWDEIMDVNLKGPFYFCKLVVPYMKKQRYGKIINIASIGGILGHEANVAHGASKAGLIGFTKNLAVELGKYNINVNAIAPGSIRSHFSDDIYNKFAERIPLKRVGEPSDVAKAVVFLASSDSDFITGEVLVVDGGHSVIIHFT